MDYLVVRTLDDVRRVHISEIGVLILESTAISITAYSEGHGLQSGSGQSFAL